MESESELHEGAASKGRMEKRCEPEDVEPTTSKKCDDEATHAESGDDVPAAQGSPSERLWKKTTSEIGWAHAEALRAQDAQSSSPDVQEAKKPWPCELGEEADEEVLVWATEPTIEALGGDVLRWRALPARARAKAARELKEQWLERAARKKPAAACAPSEPASSAGGASESAQQKRQTLRMSLRRWVERHPDEPLALQYAAALQGGKRSVIG
ncbi:MAG: hypothetical protein GY772_19365, partial [bacterium]|nr:hypothetical protein [bacterium]